MTITEQRPSEGHSRFKRNRERPSGLKHQGEKATASKIAKYTSKIRSPERFWYIILGRECPRGDDCDHCHDRDCMVDTSLLCRRSLKQCIWKFGGRCQFTRCDSSGDAAQLEEPEDNSSWFISAFPRASRGEEAAPNVSEQRNRVAAESAASGSQDSNASSVPP